MVVNDLNLLWPCGGPSETDPPLTVDANAVLTLPSTLQRFESVSRRYSELIQPLGITQLPQLTESNRVNTRVDGRYFLTIP